MTDSVIEIKKEETKTTSPKVTVVSYEEFTDIEFAPPASFFIKNAVGEFVFIHTRDRSVAQTYIDNTYGVGKYKVNASKMQKPKKEVTARGYQTRSRK